MKRGHIMLSAAILLLMAVQYHAVMMIRRDFAPAGTMKGRKQTKSAIAL